MADDQELTSDQRLVRRILRVNHAGEHGAISIYGAQLKRKGAHPTEIEEWLAETLEHEQAHRAAFRVAMRSRSAKPCRALGVWSVGGWLLGSITGMLGPTGVMACTAAVERTVHGHLEDQIAFLRRCDVELAALVEQIQAEELSHLAFAEANLKPGSLLARQLSPVIACATEVLIAVSTRGDSFRLRRTLRAHS